MRPQARPRSDRPFDDVGSADRARPASRGQDGRTLRRRLQWVVAARLFVATVLLGGTLALGSGGFGSSALLALVVGIYAASLATLLWLERRGPVPPLALAQIAVDLATTSVLVWLTGGALSGFSFLYGVVVLMAALIAGPGTTAATAGLSLVLYLTLGVALTSGWLADPSGMLEHAGSGEVGAAMLRNAVGLFLVGTLAHVLAERLRRTGGELERVAASAAEIARLHEDIVRSLTSGLVTTDLDGRVRSVNPAGERMLGPGVIGMPVERLLPVGSGSNGQDHGEGMAIRQDGSRFFVGFTRTALVDAEGRAYGALVLFQDLTELQQLREQAAKAARLAALGRLAAALAHEIRNPLGSISGSVELVRDAPSLGDEDRRLLDLVVREVERLNELVTTMLDLGRPRTPERAPIDVCALARDTVAVARRDRSAERGIAVRLEGEREVRAHADPAQVRQVLWNLIKNAMQFAPAGTEVRVGVREVPEGACIEVEDRGPGIPDEDREHLFDMFFSKRPHGVGLGLALVKQIVDAHGGRIEVESRRGEGTIFRVTLPRTADAQRESAPTT